jgi:UDP:flavonoid glycosyltransferase YjiC (YdhE family)
MRILIVTAGSRGDVAPFTGLGRRLLDAGHEVDVAAHPCFAGLVGGCGLGHRPMPGDPQELIRAWSRAASREEVRALNRAYVDGLADGVLNAAGGGPDLVLTAFGPAPLSRALGEALGVPVVGTYLAPQFATDEFALPGAPDTGAEGPEGNLAAGRAVLRSAEGLFAGAVTRLRARLGLPGPSPASPADVRPVFHGFSPSVVPRPGDWPSHVEVAGYWWPARPEGWRPPAGLVDFLRAGPPPVFIGFGSMAPGRGEELGSVVAAAVRRAGVRAVVQAGWAGLSGGDVDGHGDDVLSVGDVPHDWLFPRTAAVVPAVAVPVLTDQPFWASRLHRLGVAPPPLPLPDLTAESLAAAITTCVSEPALRRRAAGLARRVAAEDGAGRVLAHVAAAAG